MISNMRDLGGILTVSGKMIRSGCLIRSANLSNAEEPDLKGIAKVIDLRTTGEQEEGPDRLFGRESLSIPIFDSVRSGISHEKKADLGLERKKTFDMGDLYKWVVRDHRDSFARVLTAIMRHDYSNGAVLWHCTEGKDRCGLTTAFLLEILGVDRTVIMEDYLKTNEVNRPKAEKLRERFRIERGEEAAEGVYRAYIADPAYLEGAWAEMDKEEAYFDSLGLSREMVDRFREKILI